jgi:hypothetical protein
VTPGILDSIDGALRDFETSKDAMRWLPEDKRPDGPASDGIPGGAAPVAVAVTVDAEEFARALNDFAEIMARVLRPAVEDTARLFHAISAAFFPDQHLRCHTCHPARRPKPLAVDGHEYRRRMKARQRRRR